MSVSLGVSPSISSFSTRPAMARPALSPQPHDIRFGGAGIGGPTGVKQKAGIFASILAVLGLSFMVLQSPATKGHMTVKDEYGNSIAYVSHDGDIHEPMPGLNFLEKPFSTHSHVDPTGTRIVNGHKSVCQGTDKGVVLQFDKASEKIAEVKPDVVKTTPKDPKGEKKILLAHTPSPEPYDGSLFEQVGTILDPNNELTAAQLNGVACEILEH